MFLFQTTISIVYLSILAKGGDYTNYYDPNDACPPSAQVIQEKDF